MRLLAGIPDIAREKDRTTGIFPLCCDNGSTLTFLAEARDTLLPKRVEQARVHGLLLDNLLGRL